MNTWLGTHDIFSQWVIPIFYGAIVVISSDIVNSIFHIILIIFVKVFPRDLFDGLYFITTGLNLIEYTQW